MHELTTRDKNQLKCPQIHLPSKLLKSSIRAARMYIHGLACWSNQIWMHLPFRRKCGEYSPWLPAQSRMLLVAYCIPVKKHRERKNIYLYSYLLIVHIYVYMRNHIFTCLLKLLVQSNSTCLENINSGYLLWNYLYFRLFSS